MLKFKFIIFFAFCGIAVFAQSQSKLSDINKSVNGFNNTMTSNSDSALYYLHKIIITQPEEGSRLIHDQISQSFGSAFIDMLKTDTAAQAYFKSNNITIDSVEREIKQRRLNTYKLLSKLETDTNAIIKSHIYPLAMWVKAEENKNDPVKLLNTGNSYLKYLSGQNDFYAHREARYGMQLINLMSKYSQMDSVTDQLLMVIYDHLRSYLSDTPNADNGPQRNKRSWYTGMFAAANYIAAHRNPNSTKQLVYLKIAADYSPDDIPSYIKNKYELDLAMIFSMNNKSFEEDYVSALNKDDEKLKYMVKKSLLNPSFKIKAKALYNDPANFNSYWQSEFNKKFEPAPIFSLSQIDGKQYKLADIAGQWTFINFWGTRAPSCTDELPALERLYLSTKTRKKALLNIITVACKDDKTSVINFMKQFNYTFPVLMSDGQIEVDYNVFYWPTKFLISPEGTYVAIPNEVDWVKYVEEYIKEI
jgi:peroxiredoxin